eukprot:CAMPEP_0172386720 /NCGR_PEP_ID=MMETSP1061-20121228/4183_1 /TAXON_ID=37318 /ORGANISM="Pseudo-nitzschia pungens, Strain cf. pungens" /LENGTH=875 /DNA_ID=CAMNT_0013116169 /DNA_START=116 /DNA_END=2743 /DNA_ORIENTATION=-
MSNENQSLLHHEKPGNVYTGKREGTKPLLSFAALAISLVGIGMLIGSSWSGGWYHQALPQRMQPTDGSNLPPSSENANDANGGNPDTPTRNRPLCRTYGENARFAGILQTSMGSPSEQWSHIPCYAQPKKTRIWAGQESSADAANLNGFGAPDAILKVDFSRPAFPDRKPIVGFGAAFTDASALNYQSLSEDGKERLMELLFGESGIGYSIGRVHMNSCDFSIESYSFDEVDGDFELKHFDTDVTHDAQKDGMVDMLLRATSTFEAAWKDDKNNNNNNNNHKSGSSTEENDFGAVSDGDFKVFASPWSPPSWMKSPHAKDDIAAGRVHASGMTGSTLPSCLREGTGPDSKYAKAWALYFSKFVTAYRKRGVPLKAVTVQNEPEFPAPWEACSYTPETEADFVGYHLGPQLAKDHPDVRIFMFDHNKDHMVTWAKTILNKSHPSSEYVTGSAYHWYAGGMDRLLDGAVGSANMHRMQGELEKLSVPGDHLVFNSEACHCPTTGYAGGDIDIYWARAERYAHTILADLAAGSNGWVEWNLVLDSVGGPNHLHNLCDTTVLAVPHRAVDGNGIPPTMEWENTDAESMFGPVVGDGRTREELNALGFPAKHLDVGLAVQPMYFYMGHISRYVRPGSRPVMGLVDSARDGYRAFRLPGENVAGGGINDLARNGIELTAWPCEGSTRQQFHWQHKHRRITVSGHDWLGNPTRSCVADDNDESFEGVTLTDCGTDSNSDEGIGTFDLVPDAKSEYVRFVQTSGDRHRCLVLKELANDGGSYGPRGGAQVALGDCDGTSSLWLYSEATREIISDYLPGGSVCVTTGWPFLQIGAFETPNGESYKTVVVLNEAQDSANYVLYDGDELVLSGSIPPHSIQTLLLD